MNFCPLQRETTRPMKNNLTSLGLKDCPFCGATEANSMGPRLMPGARIFGSHSIECGCGGGTRQWSDKETAIKNWNKRIEKNKSNEKPAQTGAV